MAEMIVSCSSWLFNVVTYFIKKTSELFFQGRIPILAKEP